MSHTNWRTMFLLFVVAALVLAGCTTPPAAPAAPAATSAPAQEEAAAPAEEPAAGEKVVLQYWEMDWGNLVTQALQASVQKFNETHPNIEVQMTMLTWGDYMQKMLSAVAAGTPPDVTGGDSGLPFNFYAQGEALELDELYAEWKSDGTFDDLTDWGKEKWNFNGHFVGVSWQIDARAIYYRTDLFEAAGVSIPTNHDELLQVATQLTNRDAEQYGICFPGKAGSYDTDQFYMTLVFQNGGMLSDKEGNPTFETPEHEAALDLELKLLADAAPEGVPGYTFAEVTRLYEDGKCAMVFNGGWFIQQVKAEAPDIYAKTAILPPLKGTGANAQQRIVGFYNPWMIFKDTKHPKEAQEFLKFMADPENLKGVYAGDLGSKFSPFKSIREDPFWEAEPMAAELAKQVNEFAVDYWYPNNTAAIGIGSMGTSIADYIVNPVLTKARTPKEALADGQAKIGEFFVKMGE